MYGGVAWSGVTGRSEGVRDGVKDEEVREGRGNKEVRRRNAYQLVSGGRPAPSLQCSSDWPQQTSLRTASAWITGNNTSLQNT